MQITIQGFEIVGTGIAATISTWHRIVDTSTPQQYYTGLFIQDNYLEADDQLWAVLPIGIKTAIDLGLRRQPVKWGEITNNEIVALSNGTSANIATDGITTHHFVGRVANNRVSGRSEGIHVGYARLEESLHGNSPPWNLGITGALIEHNLFYCNSWQHGIHFVHASQGIVRNNLVVRHEEPDHGGEVHIARGIVAGEPSWDPNDEECLEDPDECYDMATAGDEANSVNVKIYNNTINHTDGQGLYLHHAIQAGEGNTEVMCNIIGKTGLQGMYKGAPVEAYGLNNWSPGDPPPDPWITAGHNMLHNNTVDYEAAFLIGENDRHEDSGPQLPNNPRFIKLIPGTTDEWSFMLRTVATTNSPCYNHLEFTYNSDAIDAAPQTDEWEDAEGGPGAGEEWGDLGAYGGNHNVWDPNPQGPGPFCEEYTKGVGSCAPAQ